MCGLLRIIVSLRLFCLVRGLTNSEIDSFRVRTHAERNTGLQGSVSVFQDPSNADVLVIEANGIPDHDTGTFPNDHNPNSVEAQTGQWRVPKNPQKASTTTCLPMGPIGMAINGVAIFNPFTRTCCDAGTAELDLLDSCSGHPGPGGRYHYHIYPNCVEDVVCNTTSTIIGVAFDGYPIYGPIDENGRQLTKGDLDECNGRVDSNNTYKYHVIKEYPYFLGCYSGSLRSDFGGNVRANCKCTEPVEVCTEFGNRRTIVTWKSNVFSCCTDEDSCNRTHTFVPDVTEDDENSVRTLTANVVGLLSVVAINAFVYKF